jgi:signal transduction histidine kinase
VTEGVALEVQDNGLGLTEEAQAQIFMPFFTTKPIGQGSGLGLSIVERIVRAHRGSLHVFSEGPGQGSIFTIVLPPAAETG